MWLCAVWGTSVTHTKDLRARVVANTILFLFILQATDGAGRVMWPNYFATTTPLVAVGTDYVCSVMCQPMILSQAVYILIFWTLIPYCPLFPCSYHSIANWGGMCLCAGSPHTLSDVQWACLCILYILGRSIASWGRAWARPGAWQIYYFYYYIYVTTIYNIMISSNLIGRLMLSQQDKEICQT